MNREQFVKRMQALAEQYPDMFVTGDGHTSFGQWLILTPEDYVCISPMYEFVARETGERYGEDVEIFLSYEEIEYISFELEGCELIFARGMDTVLGVSISSYDRVQEVKE